MTTMTKQGAIVLWAAKPAALGSSGLGVWSSVERSLCDDGDCRLVGVARRWLPG